MTTVRVALTIAGSDSGGGAGIQADLKTFAAFGIYGTAAVTAITAQNTRGVMSVDALAGDIVAAQMEAVAADIQVHATKVGMLATAAIVEAVAAAIDDLELPMVVLDPVVVASSGERLLDSDGVRALSNALLPRAFVITPNIPEAEVLTGLRITTVEDRQQAARRLHEMGAGAVIITGGHASASDDEVVDLLFDGSSFFEVRTPRVTLHSTQGVHGTGCTFAAALASKLVLGQALPEAAASAQRYVAGALTHAFAIGHGALVLDHFWRTREPKNLVI